MISLTVSDAHVVSLSVHFDINIASIGRGFQRWREWRWSLICSVIEREPNGPNCPGSAKASDRQQINGRGDQGIRWKYNILCWVILGKRPSFFPKNCLSETRELMEQNTLDWNSNNWRWKIHRIFFISMRFLTPFSWAKFSRWSWWNASSNSSHQSNLRHIQMYLPPITEKIFNNELTLASSLGAEIEDNKNYFNHCSVFDNGTDIDSNVNLMMFHTVISLVSLHSLVKMKGERHNWNFDRLRTFVKRSIHWNGTFRLIWWGYSSLDHLIEQMSGNVQVKFHRLHSTLAFLSLCLGRTFCGVRSLLKEHHDERICGKSSKMFEDRAGAIRRTFEKGWKSDSFAFLSDWSWWTRWDICSSYSSESFLFSLIHCVIAMC